MFTYDAWIASLDLPVHRGFFVPDLRTVELGHWTARGCGCAFIQLSGQEGISEARVTEIPPGGSLPPLRQAFDELVYVVQGQGLTSVWAGEGTTPRTFEWSPRSMFILPRNCQHQLSNARGDQAVRLLHYNYLPLGMSVIQDPDLLFDNPKGAVPEAFTSATDFYSVARTERHETSQSWDYGRSYWAGNFFPDMQAWDKLDANTRRGAGGRTIQIQFPGSEMSCHMSVFPARTYKKAHRHGPGRVIVIPGGEGYSIMWEEGKERVLVPWHEASLFVPPGRWFHQHFNLGAAPARYLAFHPPMQFHGYAEKVEDRARDQIEYPDEDPWVRANFEQELA
ncbi:MAG: cupin domain-containing protein, partial [Chloroflexi bacterium]|nr:cupin domain-containing protein [Chloroflexota bacterium]